MPHDELIGGDSLLAIHDLPATRGRLREESPLQFMLRRFLQTSSNSATGQLGDTELVAEADDHRFWELIGMRVDGCPGVILGAVKFRRQGFDPTYHRQSLPSYLALNCTGAGSGREHEVPLVSLEVPTAAESVPEFLRGLAGRSGRHPVLVDKALIQMVFDLRGSNPSAERLNRPARSSRQTVILRTRSGHLLSGGLLDLELKLRRNLPFLALTMGVQHTAHGNSPLPTLFLQRSSVAMLSVISAVDDLESKLACAPFRIDNANPRHFVLESEPGFS